MGQVISYFYPEEATPTTEAGDVDDHDFECRGFSSKPVKMSCGHTVTPESLSAWCERQLSQGKSRFECGACDATWTFGEVAALLSEETRRNFEKRLEKMTIINHRMKHCPGCSSLVMRPDQINLRVRCPQCRAEKGIAFNFCWQCLKEWKGPTARSHHCDNEGCTNEALETLRTCPQVELKRVERVKCPSVRACSTCGMLIKYNGEQCKKITCSSCKVKFCFLCLKTEAECSSSVFKVCPSGVAPRQTSIPVQKT